jgi:hypothetical protein
MDVYFGPYVLYYNVPEVPVGNTSVCGVEAWIIIHQISTTEWMYF